MSAATVRAPAMVAIASAWLAFAASARAEEPREARRSQAGGVAGAAGAPGDALRKEAAGARQSADGGAFSTWSVAARSDTQRGLVHLQGGYDAARGGATFESVAEARVFGRLSLRAGGSYVGPSGSFRPLFAGKADLLRQEASGVDVAFLAGYEPHGFNTVSAAAALVAVGRSFGGLRLLANVGYGLGLEEGEGHGDARLAVLQRLTDALRAGLDARFRIDLERDLDEPEGEPDWELLAGPSATFTAGRFVVSGGAGLSAVRVRLAPDTRAGVLAHAGLGTVF